jgi:hypothetical protein
MAPKIRKFVPASGVQLVRQPTLRDSVLSEMPRLGLACAGRSHPRCSHRKALRLRCQGGWRIRLLSSGDKLRESVEIVGRIERPLGTAPTATQAKPEGYSIARASRAKSNLQGDRKRLHPAFFSSFSLRLLKTGPQIYWNCRPTRWATTRAEFYEGIVARRPAGVTGSALPSHPGKQLSP